MHSAWVADTNMAALEACRNWAAHAPFNPQSAPMELPNRRDHPLSLPLFRSVSALATEVGASTAPADGAHDVLLHAGGPVWALSWCPGQSAGAAPESSSPPSSPEDAHFLAVGCHPAAHPLHNITAPVTGPNMIQIWQVHGVEGLRSQTQVPLPAMALGLAHEGGLTLHCCWCPCPELADGPGQGRALPRLGLLAAALGDGTMQVWAVPQPGAVPLPAGAPAGSPPIVSLPPVAFLSSGHLDGSLPCLVDWLPAKPYDLLLVGCKDGSVAILKLQPGQSGEELAAGAFQEPLGPPQGLSLVTHFHAERLPLRAAKWLPPHCPSIDLAHRHTFLTAGHDGAVRIWDARDEFEPVYRQQPTTSTLLDACWTAEPLGIMAVLEEGSLRGILLASDVIKEQMGSSPKAVLCCTWRGTNAGALCAVDTHPVAQAVAYAGDDGVVGAFACEYKWDQRKRSAHTTLGAVRVVAGGTLRVLTHDDLEQENNKGGLYSDRVGERGAVLGATQGDVPADEQTVQRLAWAPALSSEGAAWLASGAASGVVRCQWVQTRQLGN